MGDLSSRSILFRCHWTQKSVRPPETKIRKRLINNYIHVTFSQLELMMFNRHSLPNHKFIDFKGIINHTIEYEIILLEKNKQTKSGINIKVKKKKFCKTKLC